MNGHRRGRPADIVRFDHHDPWGRLIDRKKGKVTEKHIGMAIVDRAKELFNISDFDMDNWRKQMKERELADFAEMEEHARKHRQIFASKIRYNQDSKDIK